MPRSEEQTLAQTGSSYPVLHAGGLVQLRKPDEAEADTDEDTGLREFAMVAYTGDVVDLGFFWGRMVFDLGGIEWDSETIPVLRGHDSGKIAGHTETVELEDDLLIRGRLSQVGPHGQEIADRSDEGFPWQASVGLDPLDESFVEAGETVEVNGRTIDGPVTVAHRTRLAEVSFVPLGADSNTSAVALAKRMGIEMSEMARYRLQEDEEMPEEEEGDSEVDRGEMARELIEEAKDMGFSVEEIADETDEDVATVEEIIDGEVEPPEGFIEELQGMLEGADQDDEEDDMADDAEAAAKAEQKRVAELQEEFEDDPQFALKAAAEGWSVDRACREYLPRLREQRQQASRDADRSRKEAQVGFSTSESEGAPARGLAALEEKQKRELPRAQARECARAEWSSDPDIHKHFLSEKDYVAYRTAQLLGRVTREEKSLATDPAWKAVKQNRKG